jgi:hypothetical protein
MVNIMGNYKFTAGTNIIFKPGFKVFAGYPFIASIHSPLLDCGYVAKNYPLNSESETVAGEETAIEDFLFADDISVGNNGLMVYPNPSQGKVTIQLNESEVFTVQILNMNGSLIYSQEVTSGSTEVETEGFNQGMYLVKVSTGNEVFIRRLTIN